MNQLYKVVGVSKQAIHQQQKRQELFDEKVTQLMYEAELLRAEHPGCGVEKMYYTLKPDFIGRDRFIDLFMELGFRLKRKRNYRRTTYASDIYYPNLIKGLLLHSPSQVWQSDITYIRVNGDFFYAVFIIDVYTKKVVGYCVSTNMRATANVKAIDMALKSNAPPVIHHSDKGGQYVYKPYVKILNDNDVAISMCNSAMDNAYAERINQTIKNEYLDHWEPNNYNQLKKMIAEAVKHYNTKRIHNEIGRKTPIIFETEVLALPVQSRPMATIYTEGQVKMIRFFNQKRSTLIREGQTGNMQTLKSLITNN